MLHPDDLEKIYRMLKAFVVTLIFIYSMKMGRWFYHFIWVG